MNNNLLKTTVTGASLLFLTSFAQASIRFETITTDSDGNFTSDTSWTELGLGSGGTVAADRTGGGGGFDIYIQDFSAGTLNLKSDTVSTHNDGKFVNGQIAVDWTFEILGGGTADLRVEGNTQFEMVNFLGNVYGVRVTATPSELLAAVDIGFAPNALPWGLAGRIRRGGNTGHLGLFADDDTEIQAADLNQFTTYTQVYSDFASGGVGSDGVFESGFGDGTPVVFSSGGDDLSHDGGTTFSGDTADKLFDQIKGIDYGLVGSGANEELAYFGQQVWTIQLDDTGKSFKTGQGSEFRFTIDGQQYASTLGAATAAAVPEPSSSVFLLLSAGMGIFFLRRR